MQFDTLVHRPSVRVASLVSCSRNKHIFRCDQNGPPARRSERDWHWEGTYRFRYDRRYRQPDSDRLEKQPTDSRGLYWFPRLRGTAALQVRNGHRTLDRDLEGARSLGATLGDGSFVRSAREKLPNCWGALSVPRLRGTAALQVRNGHCRCNTLSRKSCRPNAISAKRFPL
jgi:hypothetical protein